MSAGALAGLLLALFGGAQVARAATPQWTATVTSRDCTNATITLALNNTSTQTVLFSMWQNTTYKSGFPPGREEGTQVWQQQVASGQTIPEHAGVASDDSFGITRFSTTPCSSTRSRPTARPRPSK